MTKRTSAVRPGPDHPLRTGAGAGSEAAVRRPARYSEAPRRYGEHLVFSLHVLAFVWLALACAYGLGLVAEPVLGAAGRVGGGLAGGVILLLVTPVYLVRAVRTAYQFTWSWAIAVSVALTVAFLVLIVAYRGLLFFTTYASL